MPEKQQRKTLICVSRKAPDVHSDLHKKHGDMERAMQNNSNICLAHNNRKKALFTHRG